MSVSGVKPIVAVFDFDKTITDRHTFWRYLLFLVGATKFWLVGITMVPTGIRLWRKKIPLMKAREVLIRRCMKGVCANLYEEKGKEFSAQKLNNWLDPKAIEKLRWHQSQNHRCLLISNSAECYLGPWSEKIGFEFFSGSRFEHDNKKLTGKMQGEHCQGEEKVVRLKQILDLPLAEYEIYAYGDSDSDKNLLEIADHPFYRKF